MTWWASADIIVGPMNAVVSASQFGNRVKDNLTDLDARANALRADLGAWSGGTAISRLGTLETRTTDTSGVVGIGNQRLSDRLGAGITTTATADARLGSGVGTGANVTTGSASSQIADLRARIAVLETRVGVRLTRTLTTDAAAINGRRLIFDTVDLAAAGMAVASNTVITVTNAGVYDFGAAVQLVSSAAILEIYIADGNGTSPDPAGAWAHNMSANATKLSCAGQKFLAAGAKICAFVYTSVSVPALQHNDTKSVPYFYVSLRK